MGKMDNECDNCGALHFLHEPKTNGTYSSCCANGKIKVSRMKHKPFPKFMKDLFAYESSKSKVFYKHLRQINAAFRFGAPITQEIKSKGGGPVMYRQHGEFQRAFNCGTLPDDLKKVKYGLMYMMETKDATDLRLENNANLSNQDKLFSDIAAVLKDNSYAQAYTMLKDEQKRVEQEALENNTNPPPMKLLFSIKPGTDLRRYNAPASNEVAAVYIESPHDERPPSYIVANEKDGRLNMLSVLDEASEPMLYPMFLPFG